MAESIATLYVDIVPSVRGIQGQLASQLNPQVVKAAEQAGKEGGKALGNNISSGARDSLAATKTLGKDLAAALRPALTGTQNLVSGFKDAQAAASSFTGYLGSVGGAARKVADTAAVPGQNFVSGFKDAQAAASTFTGHLGTLGGATRKVADVAALPAQNFVSGFRDAQAAASSFTGHLGTLGGATRKVADVAALPAQNFVSGFRNAQAAASTFTGHMGSLGGATRTLATTAALPGREFVTGFKNAGDAAVRSSSLFARAGSAVGTMATSAQTGLSRVTTSTLNAGRQVAGAVSAASGAVRGVVTETTGAFKTFGTSISSSIAPVRGHVADLTNGISGIGTAALTAAGTTAGAIAGIAAVGGFNRAVQIEQAQAKLKGLGNSAEDIETIMENANNAVLGTSADLNESATVAAAAVAAGVKPGKDLEQVLSTINDTAGIAGMSMQDAGAIFNSVLARGKLQGDDLLQLTSRGVPVLKFLSDELGVSTEQVSKWVSKGQISFDEFASAMEHGVGGSAVAMGKTTSGALANLTTAISRFGANAITPFMPIIQSLALGLTAVFDGLGAAVKPAAQAVADALVAMVQPGSFVATTFQFISDKAAAFIDIAAGVIDAIPAPALAGIAGVLGVLAVKFGAAKIAAAPLVGIIGKIFAALGLTTGKLAIFGRAFTLLTGPVGIAIALVGAAIGSSEELRTTIGQVMGTIGGLVATLVAQLVPLFAQLASAILPAVVMVFQTVVTVVAQLLTAILPLVATLLAQLLPVFVQLISTILPPVVTIITAIIQVVAALVMALMPVITTILNLLVPVLQFVVTVVAALASGILTLIGGAVTWLTTVAVPALGVALQAVGGFFSWLWTGVVQPVWTWIQGAISNVVTWIATIVVPWVQTAMAALGLVFSWLYTTVVLPVWDGIKTAIAVAVAVVMTIWQGLVAFVQGVLAPLWNWLYATIILPAWNGIKNVIAAAWAWIRDTVFTPLMNFVRGPLTSAWLWIRNVVAQVWGAIKSAIASAWAWVRDAVLSPLIGFVRGPLTSAWTWLRNLVAQVWGAIRSAIAAAWAWIRDAVLNPLIGYVRGALTGAWRWIGSVVSQVWNGIRTTVSNTWNFVRGSILQPMINFLRGSVVNAWNAAKDGISRAWNAVKGIVDKPVDFVINTVINGGFIKNFNKVATKFGIDPVDEIHYKGLARGGVVPGYQRRKVDDHLAPVAGGGVQPLRGGEGILVPEATRALGPSWIHGMNAAANTGGVSGAQSWLDQHKPSIETFPKDNDKRFAMGPPGGPSGGLWSSNQARASQLGYFNVPRGSISGVSFESAAKAWMGRSALEIRMGSGGPGVQSISGGGGGPWGYATSDGRITITPGGPAAVGKNAVRGTLIHEIGHVLSLNHPPGGYGATGTIMSAGMSGGYWPSSLDYAKLAEIYGRPGEGVKTYDDPGGGGGILSGLLDMIGFDKLMEKIPGAGFAKDLMVGAAKTAWEGFKSWAASVINPFDGGDSEVASGQSAESWRDTVIEALKRAGLPSTKPYQDAWVKQIDTESGGDPNSVQGAIGDINNITGDLGKGLVMVIGSTFAANRDPSLPNNQFDPLANLVAGMRYAKSTYGVEGMLGAIGKGHGYARGGILPDNLSTHVFDGGGWLRKTTDPMLVHHRETRPDAVLTHQQFQDMHALAREVEDQRGPAGTWENHFHLPEAPEDPDKLGRRAGEAFAFEMMRAGI
ncbi:tape measure protein [Kocuria rhizophila]|uniref:tape measure protein n=1 Tax=Kocuria rhizophila TaxID=72000 RepID=UPI0002F18679|nr:tape measure domain-containing protein [Kocuria rhizophila]